MSVAEPSAEQQIHLLYSDHSRWLRDWLRRRLGCAEQAADIAHDTFVRLLVSPRSLSGEPRAFLTYVAKGLVIDHWRRKEIEQAYLDTLAHLPEPEAPSPEQQLLIVETLLRIDVMLHAMPGPTREIFLLAQLDGLGYAEIAARLELSLITVKRHMHKAFIACMTVA